MRKAIFVVLIMLFLPFTAIVGKSTKKSELSISSTFSKGLEKVWETELEDGEGIDLIVQDECIYTIGAFDGMSYFIKWDSNGTSLWKKRGISGNSLWSDGYYLYTEGNFLRKWFPNGTLVWEIGMEGFNIHNLQGDENYLYFTNRSYFYDDNISPKLVKSYLNGTVIWEQYYHETINSLCIDDEYLYTTGYNSSDNQLSFNKHYKDNGTIVYRKLWGDSSSYERGDSIWFDGKHLYVLGITRDNSRSDYGGFVFIKWDPNGTVIWQRFWDDNKDVTSGYSIWSDEKHLYTTERSEVPAMIVWDPNGTVVWRKPMLYHVDGMIRSIRGDGEYVYTTGVKNGKFILTKWAKGVEVKGLSKNKTETTTIIDNLSISTTPFNFFFFSPFFFLFIFLRKCNI